MFNAMNFMKSLKNLYIQLVLQHFNNKQVHSGLEKKSTFVRVMKENTVLSKIALKTKLLGILIDPDKYTSIQELEKVIEDVQKVDPDFLFVGGSLINHSLMDEMVELFKTKLSIPVVLFPGNNQQISSKADAILLLSLISGRNAELLIGQHVQSAFVLKTSGLEIIPTGYILIDGEIKTSVQYISNTQPIPNNKNKIATATALAGEQLGLKLIYLDAGSGANKTVPLEMINTVRQNIQLPIIVGGGIKSRKQIKQAWQAGANLVIVGTAFEENPNNLLKN